MEPFQLVCQSCAAKLKVKNRSAIGQRLACPRCREMILVTAPEGHDIGESLAATGSFDEMDMDSILENRQLEPKKPKGIRQPAPQPPKQRAVVRPSKQVASSPANPELAPGQEWVNPATKKKQRLVLMIMGAVGSLLLLAAVVFSILKWSGSSEVEVASTTDADSVEVRTKEEPAADSDPNLVSETAEMDELTTEDTKVDELQADPVSDVPPEIGEAPPIAGIPSMPPDMPITEKSVGADAEVEGFGDPKSTATDSTEAKMDSDVPEFSEATDELEKLKSILAEAGTSLLEIQGAASNVRSELAVGTPKYYFERTSFELSDPTRRKDQILLGVKYQQQPLQTVLHELSAISGLILTIDVPSIAAAGAEFNPMVDFKAENESTATVIRKVAESVGLVAIETDDGFWITVQDDGKLQKLDINIAVIVENEEDAQGIIRAIKALVYPNSWKNDAADANVAVQPKPAGTITFADGKLQLENSSGAIREIQSFVDAIKAAARGDLNSSTMLQPVVWLDDGAFANAYDSENSIRIPVSTFFQKLAKENGVQLTADWRSLARNDWSTDAMAPGWMDERTIGSVIKETAHGLGASFYVADEKTVWLTSPQVANDIFVLKLYPVEKLAGGRLNKERLSRILFDSLGDQLNQPGVSLELLVKQKLVAVRAPQSLQRQIRAVFETIK